MSLELKLGVTVEDMVTKMQGTVVSRSEHMTGMVQYGVQPQGDGKTIPESFDFDPHMLVVLDDGVSKHATPCPEPSIKLGVRAKDKVTEIEGVVTRLVFSLNGCVYGALVPKSTDKEHKILYLDHTRFIELPEEPIKPEAPTRRGGPTARSLRHD